MDLEKIKIKLREFAQDRDWNKFHSPKNLSMALTVEASELLEIFQWITEKESNEIQHNEKFQNIKEEVADIALYLIRFCDVLDINLEEEILKKMSKNQDRYPVEKAKGNSKKYSEL